MRIARVLALTLLALAFAPAGGPEAEAQPGGACTPKPDQWCGLQCEQLACWTVGPETERCMEIPGGCGSWSDPECCPAD
jgi:hypothetical protein